MNSQKEKTKNERARFSSIASLAFLALILLLPEKEKIDVNPQIDNKEKEVEKGIQADLSLVDKEASDQIVKGFTISVSSSALASAGFYLYPHLPPFGEIPSGQIFLLAYFLLGASALLLIIYSACLFASAARRIYISHKNNSGKPISEKTVNLVGWISAFFFQASFTISFTYFVISLLEKSISGR